MDALASEFVSKPGHGKTDQADRQDFPHIIVFNLDKNRQKASTFDFLKGFLHKWPDTVRQATKVKRSG